MVCAICKVKNWKAGKQGALGSATWRRTHLSSPASVADEMRYVPYIAAMDVEKELKDLKRRVDLAETRLSQIEGLFGFVSGQLRDIQLYMHSRFDEIETRFDGVDGCLDGVDRRLDGMGRHLEGMDRHLDGMDGKLDKLPDLVAGAVGSCYARVSSQRITSSST